MDAGSEQYLGAGYTDGNGTSRRGLAARVVLWDGDIDDTQKLIVGKGSIIHLDGEGRWEVTDVEAGIGGDTAFIILEKVKADNKS